MNKLETATFEEYDSLNVAFIDLHLIKTDDGFYLPNVVLFLNIEGKDDPFGLCLPFFDVYETTEEAVYSVMTSLCRIETEGSINEVMVFDMETGEQIKDETILVSDVFMDEGDCTGCDCEGDDE